MAGKDSGNNRIADLMQGNPLDFGGIGISSWRTGSEPQAGYRLPSLGFQVYEDAENQPLPEKRLRAKVFNDENRAPDPRPRAKMFGEACADVFVVRGDENCPPVSARSRAKPAGPAAAGGLGWVYQDSRPAADAHTAATAASFQVFDESKPQAKTFSQAVTGAVHAQDETRAKSKPFGPVVTDVFQVLDENVAGSRPLAVRADQATARPSRAQQRKQKLKQRPLQDLQNTKRATLQSVAAPLQEAAAGRLPAVCEEPPPAGDSDKENASPPEVHAELMWPAPMDAAMSSPQSLHTSLDSITLGTRRGRLDALFSYEEYAADLYLIMRQAELKHRPRADFMARQPDITVTMRSILVDWLVEVNDEYKLNPETLHLAVNYIDRFLSVMTVVRAKLQLVGTTALFIASKFEEIYPPTVAEFVYITDDTYTASQLKRMEHVMLKMLAFDMSAPTANWFLNYLLDNGGASEDTVRYLAQYLVELGLVQYELCNHHISSIQAAAALFLARLTTDHEPWTAHLQTVSGFSLGELRPCVEQLLLVFRNARDQPQQAVLEKFTKDKFLTVSQLEPPASLAGLF